MAEPIEEGRTRGKTKPPKVPGGGRHYLTDADRALLHNLRERVATLEARVEELERKHGRDQG